MKKTILLTGATDGIGFEAAKTFIEQGHTLLIHGRSESKLEKTKAVLESLNGAGEIHSYLADLSDFSHVRNMADAIKADHKALDVIINCAGILKTPNTITKDGLDVRFVVNTLAPFILTNALLPILNANGRVVNLSSAAQRPVDLNALAGQGQLDDMNAYAQSKLAITMWSAHLAEHLKDGLICVSLNPGSLLATKMVREGFGIDGSDVRIGADIIVKSALGDEFENANGKYYDNDARQFGPPHPDAMDKAKVDEVVEAIAALADQFVA